MSVSPIGGVTNTSALQQPTAPQTIVPGSATATAAQASPTVDAAQAWEDAMRAAMGDESSSTASASAIPTAGASPTPTAGASATPTPGASATASAPGGLSSQSASPELTPQALAALVSGSSTAPTDPLITSLSAPTDATTTALPASDAGSSSLV